MKRTPGKTGGAEYLCLCDVAILVLQERVIDSFFASALQSKIFSSTI
jgi:hypothetical protein